MKFRTEKFPYRTAGKVLLILCALVSLCFVCLGILKVTRPVPAYEKIEERVLSFDGTTVEYDEDTGILRAVYQKDGFSFEAEFAAESGDEAPNSVVCYVYASEDGSTLYFQNEPTRSDLIRAVRDENADAASLIFGVALAVGFFAIALAVVLFFGKFFSAYEKIWFLSVSVLASLFSVLFPEESCNGVNGLVIMGLYLLDTFLNVLCELLISKQSRWNFIVSVFVEIAEISICLVLAYRFATMATTLFFWLPCDILSFVNWNKKKDEEKEEVTKVRTLRGWQEALVLFLIVAWTAGIGYLLTTFSFGTDLFGGNRTLEVIVCYLDACASAVGVVNGLAILFRFREQWIAWYISAILETVMNILAGQYVLLILKAGYLSNTTYGYIRWSRYIKEHRDAAEEKSFF